MSYTKLITIFLEKNFFKEEKKKKTQLKQQGRRINVPKRGQKSVGL